jgi:hypothetical protein
MLAIKELQLRENAPRSLDRCGDRRQVIPSPAAPEVAAATEGRVIRHWKSGLSFANS